MRTTHVVVKPYDKKWKMDFEDIKKEIQSAIGDLILSLIHICWNLLCIDECCNICCMPHCSVDR